MAENIKICRLCCAVINDGCFEVIHGDRSEMLKNVLQNINLSVSENPVLCYKCSGDVQKCFEFKMICSNTEDRIKTFVTWDNPVRVNLEEVLMKEIPSSTGDNERRKICRLCFNSDDNMFFQVNTVEDVMLGDLLIMCIPELNFELTNEPLMCSVCLEMLKLKFSLINKSFEFEEKIRRYRTTLSDPNTHTVDLIKVMQFFAEMKTETGMEHLKEGGGSNSNIPRLKENADVESAFSNIKAEIQPEAVKIEEPQIHLEILQMNQLGDEIVRLPEITKLPSTPSQNPKQQYQNTAPADHQTPGQHNWEPPIDQPLITQADITNLTPQQILQNDSFLVTERTKMHKCKFCDYVDMDNHKLKLHYLTHNQKIRMFRCKVCPFITQHKNVIDNHNTIHMKPEEIDWCECDICGFRTKLKCNLEKHQLTHRNTDDLKKFKCENCSYRSMWKRDLERHILKHVNPEDITMHKCDYCMFSTRHKRYLKYHVSKVHLKEEPAPAESYKCAQCGFATRKKRSLVPHMLTHRRLEDIKTYKCSYCPYQAKWKEAVKRHEEIHKKVFRCELCDFQTRLKRFLKQHVLGHRPLDDIPIYGCLQCDFRTGYKYSLMKHQLTHKPEEECEMHRCAQCPYKTKRKQDLRHHTQVRHTEDMQVYNCKLCSYQSKYRNNLKNHIIRVHNSQSMPLYCCKSCTFQTRYPRSLECHEVSFHKDKAEIPMIKCDVCIFETTRKDLLKKHKLLHRSPDEIEWFKCKVCNFQSKYKRALRKHMECHLPEDEKKQKVVTFECSDCNFKTNWKSTLRKHIISHMTGISRKGGRPKTGKAKSKQSMNNRKHVKKDAVAIERKASPEAVDIKPLIDFLPTSM